ncbi:MAG: LOG family protein, partial [Candidatus Omnitrophica bacterium]|nr:LOG family protein [Candidatus Omnitrophota bacterium]
TSEQLPQPEADRIFYAAVGSDADAKEVPNFVVKNLRQYVTFDGFKGRGYKEFGWAFEFMRALTDSDPGLDRILIRKGLLRSLAQGVTYIEVTVNDIRGLKFAVLGAEDAARESKGRLQVAVLYGQRRDQMYRVWARPVEEQAAEMARYEHMTLAALIEDIRKKVVVEDAHCFGIMPEKSHAEFNTALEEMRWLCDASRWKSGLLPAEQLRRLLIEALAARTLALDEIKHFQRVCEELKHENLVAARRIVGISFVGNDKYTFPWLYAPAIRYAQKKIKMKTTIHAGKSWRPGMYLRVLHHVDQDLALGPNRVEHLCVLEPDPSDPNVLIEEGLTDSQRQEAADLRRKILQTLFNRKIPVSVAFSSQRLGDPASMDRTLRLINFFARAFILKSELEKHFPGAFNLLQAKGYLEVFPDEKTAISGGAKGLLSGDMSALENDRVLALALKERFSDLVVFLKQAPGIDVSFNMPNPAVEGVALADDIAEAVLRLPHMPFARWRNMVDDGDTRCFHRTVEVLIERLLEEMEKVYERTFGLWHDICVFGSARTGRGHPLKVFEMGEALGVWIMRLGETIVTGGGPAGMEGPLVGYIKERSRHGAQVTMATMTRVVRIALNFFEPLNVYAEKVWEFNHFMFRKEALFRFAKGVIALPGGFGTMEEILEAVVRGHRVQCLGDFWKPVMQAFDRYWQKAGLPDRVMSKLDFTAWAEDTWNKEPPQALLNIIKNPLKPAQVTETERQERRRVIREGIRMFEALHEPIVFGGDAGTDAQWQAMAETMRETVARGIPVRVISRGRAFELAWQIVVEEANRPDLFQAVLWSGTHKAPWENNETYALACFEEQVLFTTDYTMERFLGNYRSLRMVLTPGGEALTLLMADMMVVVQTKKVAQRPIVLIDDEGGAADELFAALESVFEPAGTITKGDLNIVRRLKTGSGIIQYLFPASSHKSPGMMIPFRAWFHWVKSDILKEKIACAWCPSVENFLIRQCRMPQWLFMLLHFPGDREAARDVFNVVRNASTNAAAHTAHGVFNRDTLFCANNPNKPNNNSVSLLFLGAAAVVTTVCAAAGLMMYPHALDHVPSLYVMFACYGLGTVIGWITAMIDKKPLGWWLMVKGLVLDTLVIGWTNTLWYDYVFPLYGRVLPGSGFGHQVFINFLHSFGSAFPFFIVYLFCSLLWTARFKGNWFAYLKTAHTMYFSTATVGLIYWAFVILGAMRLNLPMTNINAVATVPYAIGLIWWGNGGYASPLAQWLPRLPWSNAQWAGIYLGVVAGFWGGIVGLGLFSATPCTFLMACALAGYGLKSFGSTQHNTRSSCSGPVNPELPIPVEAFQKSALVLRTIAGRADVFNDFAERLIWVVADPAERPFEARWKARHSLVGDAMTYLLLWIDMVLATPASLDACIQRSTVGGGQAYSGRISGQIEAFATSLSALEFAARKRTPAEKAHLAQYKGTQENPVPAVDLGSFIDETVIAVDAERKEKFDRALKDIRQEWTNVETLFNDEILPYIRAREQALTDHSKDTLCQTNNPNNPNRNSVSRLLLLCLTGMAALHFGVPHASAATEFLAVSGAAGRASPLLGIPVSLALPALFTTLLGMCSSLFKSRRPGTTYEEGGVTWEVCDPKDMVFEQRNKRINITSKVTYKGDPRWVKQALVLESLDEAKTIVPMAALYQKIGRLGFQGLNTAEAFLDVRGAKTIVMTTLPPGKPLKDPFFRGITTAGKVDIILQVARALKVFHDHVGVHADVHPLNVWVTDQGRVILFDYDVAFSTSDEFMARKLMAACFDPDFSSRKRRMIWRDQLEPEWIKRPAWSTITVTKDMVFGPEEDVYALSTMLLYLLFGQDGLQEYNSRGFNDFEKFFVRDGPVNVEPEMMDFLRRALVDDPQKGFQAAEAFIAALERVRAALRGPAKRVELTADVFRKTNVSMAGIFLEAEIPARQQFLQSLGADILLAFSIWHVIQANAPPLDVESYACTSISTMVVSFKGKISFDRHPAFQYLSPRAARYIEFFETRCSSNEDIERAFRDFLNDIFRVRRRLEAQFSFIREFNDLRPEGQRIRHFNGLVFEQKILELLGFEGEGRDLVHVSARKALKDAVSAAQLNTMDQDNRIRGISGEVTGLDELAIKFGQVMQSTRAGVLDGTNRFVPLKAVNKVKEFDQVAVTTENGKRRLIVQECKFSGGYFKLLQQVIGGLVSLKTYREKLSHLELVNSHPDYRGRVAEYRHILEHEINGGVLSLGIAAYLHRHSELASRLHVTDKGFSFRVPLSEFHSFFFSPRQRPFILADPAVRGAHIDWARTEVKVKSIIDESLKAGCGNEEMVITVSNADPEGLKLLQAIAEEYALAHAISFEGWLQDRVRLAAIDTVIIDFDGSVIGIDEALLDSLMANRIEALLSSGVHVIIVTGRSRDSFLSHLGKGVALRFSQQRGRCYLVTNTGAAWYELMNGEARLRKQAPGTEDLSGDIGRVLTEIFRRSVHEVFDHVGLAENMPGQKISLNAPYDLFLSLKEESQRRWCHMIADRVNRHIEPLKKAGLLPSESRALISSETVYIALHEKAGFLPAVLRELQGQRVVFLGDSMGTAYYPGNDRSVFTLSAASIQQLGLERFDRIYVGHERMLEIPEGIIRASAAKGEKIWAPARRMMAAIVQAKKGAFLSEASLKVPPGMPACPLWVGGLVAGHLGMQIFSEEKWFFTGIIAVVWSACHIGAYIYDRKDELWQSVARAGRGLCQNAVRLFALVLFFLERMSTLFAIEAPWLIRSSLGLLGIFIGISVVSFYFAPGLLLASAKLGVAIAVFMVYAGSAVFLDGRARRLGVAPAMLALTASGIIYGFLDLPWHAAVWFKYGILPEMLMYAVAVFAANMLRLMAVAGKGAHGLAWPREMKRASWWRAMLFGRLLRWAMAGAASGSFMYAYLTFLNDRWSLSFSNMIVGALVKTAFDQGIMTFFVIFPMLVAVVELIGQRESLRYVFIGKTGLASRANIFGVFRQNIYARYKGLLGFDVFYWSVILFVSWSVNACIAGASNAFVAMVIESIFTMPAIFYWYVHLNKSYVFQSRVRVNEHNWPGLAKNMVRHIQRRIMTDCVMIADSEATAMQLAVFLNKHAGIRAAFAVDENSVSLAREQHHANILILVRHNRAWPQCVKQWRSTPSGNADARRGKLQAFLPDSKTDQPRAYDMPVPPEVQQNIETRDGVKRLCWSAPVQGLRLLDQKNQPMAYEARSVQRALYLLGAVYGRASPRPKCWTVRVTTSLEQTRGCVAACRIKERVVSLSPYFFTLPLLLQARILYHELISHMAKDLRLESSAKADTDTFWQTKMLDHPGIRGVVLDDLLTKTANIDWSPDHLTGAFQKVQFGRYLTAQYAVKYLEYDECSLSALDNVEHQANDVDTLLQLHSQGQIPSLALPLAACREGFTMYSIQPNYGNYKIVDPRRPFDPARVTELARRMAEAVQQLHSRHMLHRDIKPDNFIVDVDPATGKILSVVLCDLGFAVPAGTITETTGAQRYMWPQDWKERNARVRQDERADLYALGLTICEMSTGAAFNIRQYRTRMRALGPSAAPLLDVIEHCINVKRQKGPAYTRVSQAVAALKRAARAQKNADKKARAQFDFDELHARAAKFKPGWLLR